MALVSYESILRDDEISETIIFESFDKQTEILLQEYYCDNPNCDCFEVQLVFHQLFDNRTRANYLFSARVSLKDLQVLEIEKNDPKFKHEQILTLIQNNPKYLTLFQSHYRKLKHYYEFYVPATKFPLYIPYINHQSWIAYEDIFNKEHINLKMGTNVYLLQDQYRLNKYSTDVKIHFYDILKEKVIGDLVLDLNTLAIKESKLPKEFLLSFQKELGIIHQYQGRLVMVRKFVDQILTSEYARQIKLNRNDPCLCGSGKKFKHCCGRN